MKTRSKKTIKKNIKKIDEHVSSDVQKNGGRIERPLLLTFICICICFQINYIRYLSSCLNFTT